MNNLILVTKEFDGRTFSIGITDEAVRKYAEDKLDKNIEQYKTDKKLSSKDPGEYAVEIAEQRANAWNVNNVGVCQNCKSKNLVRRVNRMRAFGGLFWRDSKPSHYDKCSDCGNEQEIVSPTYPHLHEKLFELAEHKIAQANKRINPPKKYGGIDDE